MTRAEEATSGHPTRAVAGGALRRLRVGIGAVLMITGCEHCGEGGTGATGGSVGVGGNTAHDQGGGLPIRVDAPGAWALATVRGPQGVAAPGICTMRGPVLRGPVKRETHFLADARSPGVLVAAETRREPPEVLRSGTLTFEVTVGPGPLGKGTPGAWVPWPDARSAPRLARSGESWVAAWETAAENGSAVTLYRGGRAAWLGTGDAFVAADLSCDETRCALLTSRLGRVAPAGAEVHLFEAKAGGPVQKVEIVPGPTDEEPGSQEPGSQEPGSQEPGSQEPGSQEPGSQEPGSQEPGSQEPGSRGPGSGEARPFGVAGLEEGGATVVLTERGEGVFWRVDASGEARVAARRPAPFGVLDAGMLKGKPVLVAHGNVVDEHGCAREGSDASGAKVRVVRAEGSTDVRSPGAPALAALRGLARGGLLVWAAPLGCGAERRVVFGVGLDDTGAPVGAPMPIADGETFALSALGDVVDLWIRQGEEVSWVRLRCEVP